MSDGYSEPVPAWMGGRTTRPPAEPTPEPGPAPLDPAAVLDAVRAMTDGQRRELAALLAGSASAGLVKLPPFREGEVPPGVPDAHLRNHNPVW